MVHTDCVQKWLSLGNSTCIYCRGSWEEFNSKKSKTTSKKGTGYINLSNRRGYTYYGSDSDDATDEDVAGDDTDEDDDEDEEAGVEEEDGSDADDETGSN